MGDVHYTRRILFITDSRIRQTPAALPADGGASHKIRPGASIQVLILIHALIYIYNLIINHLLQFPITQEYIAQITQSPIDVKQIYMLFK